MLIQIIINYICGLTIGYLFEFSYRTWKHKKFIKPKFINAQMYGLMGTFLYLLYTLNAPIIITILLILFFSTGLEFLIGYGYLKLKNIRLWDYSGYLLNYKGIICPLFSFYWLTAALFYFYFIIPQFIKLF